MGSNPLGRWMEFPTGGSDFSHFFPVSAGGGNARVGKGYILGDVAVEPKIGDVPISGDKKKNLPAPVLKLGKKEGPDQLNPNGETWVCVEVTPDAEGKLGKESKVVVVQRAQPLILEGPTGRYPLAMLTFRSNSFQVYQITFFHLRYVTTLPADGKRRHFFL